MTPLLKPRGYPSAVSRHQVGNGDGGACGVTQPASSTVYAEVPDHLVDMVHVRDMVNLRRNQVVGALHLQLRPPVAAARRAFRQGSAIVCAT